MKNIFVLKARVLILLLLLHTTGALTVFALDSDTESSSAANGTEGKLTFREVFDINIDFLDNFYVGYSLEVNGNSREGMAAALFGLTLGTDLNSHLAAGFKTSYSHNFDTVGTWEIQTFFRYKLFQGLPDRRRCG